MSEWTVDTLKEHISSLMEQRFRAQETALDKLASESKDRQEKLAADLREYKAFSNEWRGQSADQTALFPTRLEVEAKLDAMAREIKANREAASEQIKTKNLQVVLSMVVGAAATLITVFNFAHNLAS